MHTSQLYCLRMSSDVLQGFFKCFARILQVFCNVSEESYRLSNGVWHVVYCPGKQSCVQGFAICCSTHYICCKSTAFVYLCMFTTVRVRMCARMLAFLCVCDCVCVCICLSVRLCVSVSVSCATKSCATKSQNIILPPAPSPPSSYFQLFLMCRWMDLPPLSTCERKLEGKLQSHNDCEQNK